MRVRLTVAEPASLPAASVLAFPLHAGHSPAAVRALWILLEALDDFVRRLKFDLQSSDIVFQFFAHGVLPDWRHWAATSGECFTIQAGFQSASDAHTIFPGATGVNRPNKALERMAGLRLIWIRESLARHLSAFRSGA